MLHVAGADAEFEAAVREEIDGGCFAGEECRVAEVVIEHQRANPQPFGRVGGHGETGERWEEFEQVVGGKEDVVAEVFRLASERLPGLAAGRGPHGDAEAEGVGHISAFSHRVAGGGRFP